MVSEGQLKRFKPALTLQALAVVRREHPLSVDSPQTPSDDVVSRVRIALKRAGDETSLRTTAQAFAPLELRAVLRLVAIDPDRDVKGRGEWVLNYRARRDLLRDAWALLLAYHPVVELESFVRSSGKQFGWKDLASATYLEDRFRAWFAAQGLVVGMASDCEQLGVADVDAWLTTVAVDPRTALASGVWRQVLVAGSASFLSRHKASVLIARADTFPSEIRAGFGRNYLESLGTRDEWAEPVLIWIRRIFGVPAAGDVQTPFWRAISSKVRGEFRLWVQEQTLKDFFQKHADTAGRFKFWKRYSKFWREVYTAIDGRVMVMDFGGVGVIEFAEVGNAAYVYDDKGLKGIVAGNPRAIGEFKDQAVAIGRVFHFQNWEYRAAGLIEPLLRRR